MRPRHALTVLLILAMVALAACQSTNVEHMSLIVPGGGSPAICETGLQPPTAEIADEEAAVETAEIAEKLPAESPATAPQPQPITVIIGNTKTVATSAADSGDGKTGLWSWLTALAAGGALGALAAP